MCVDFAVFGSLLGFIVAMACSLCLHFIMRLFWHKDDD